MELETDAAAAAGMGENRRQFFAAMLAGAFAIGVTGQARAQSATPSNTDLLVLSLNLEYLIGELYSYGVYSGRLPANDITGNGVQGGAVVGGKPVPGNRWYTSVRNFCDETAVDDYFHIQFLRDTLRGDVVAEPQIDLSGGANGPFTQLLRASGAIGATDTFEPFESAESFLMSAMVLKELIVSFYLGIAPLYANAALQNVAIGRIGGHATNLGAIRGALYRYTANNAAQQQRIDGFARAVSQLSTSSTAVQGIGRSTVDGRTVANVTSTDANGYAFGRSAAQALNIAFLTRTAKTMGGFFPNGLNAKLNVSAAL